MYSPDGAHTWYLRDWPPALGIKPTVVSLVSLAYPARVWNRLLNIYIHTVEINLYLIGISTVCNPFFCTGYNHGFTNGHSRRWTRHPWIVLYEYLLLTYSSTSTSLLTSGRSAIPFLITWSPGKHIRIHKSSKALTDYIYTHSTAYRSIYTAHYILFIWVLSSS